MEGSARGGVSQMKSVIAQGRPSEHPHDVR